MNSLVFCKGGSNTDSGSKITVECKNTTILYIAFIIRNLSLILYDLEYTIKIEISTLYLAFIIRNLMLLKIQNKYQIYLF